MVSASVLVGDTPNVNAIAQSLSGVQLSDPLTQQLVNYMQNPVFNQDLTIINGSLAVYSLKDTLLAFKCARLFMPHKIYSMQPGSNLLEESLLAIPFLNSPRKVAALKDELPEYIAKVADTDANFPATDRWKQNSHHLPNWASAAKVLLMQPSSGAAESFFPLLRNTFGEQQENSLQDYIESSLMLQYNGH